MVVAGRGQRAEMGWRRAQGRWVYLKAAALGLGLSLAVFLVFLAAFGLGLITPT